MIHPLEREKIVDGNTCCDVYWLTPIAVSPRCCSFANEVSEGRDVLFCVEQADRANTTASDLAFTF